MHFKRILAFARRHHRLLAVALLFAIVAVCASLVPPALAGTIVDRVFVASVQDGDFKGRVRLLSLLILAIMSATVLRAISIYLRNWMLERYSQRVIRDLKQQMYDHIQSLSFDFFHKTRTGELMARMTNDVEMVRALLVLGVMHGATGIFYFVSASAILINLHWQLALVSMLAAPFLFVATYKLRRDFFPKGQLVRTQYSALNTAVQENISGIRVVKSFMRHRHELEKFDKENTGLTQRRDDAVGVWARYMPIIEFLSGISAAVVLVAGGWMVIYGRITLGLWVQFNSYLWMLIQPMRMLGEVANQIALAEASAERIFEILDLKPNIANNPGAIAPNRVRGDVEFRNVSWSVDKRSILRNVNLHARPGSTIAIMGPTGSGKSSLVHLITRFYDPDEGSVFIDGIDIRNLDLKTLRDNIGLVAQETFLFSETMYNNLTYGRAGAPIDLVQRVAVQTQAHMFVSSMADGYGTVVGERGVGLSGGQKQRASIARALLKQAPILILDDSTSSVDTETEALIQDALQNLDHQVTTFIIAHRISSVRHADEIIVLDHGEIVERGKHDELLRRGGYYSDFFSVQYADAEQINGSNLGAPAAQEDS